MFNINCQPREVFYFKYSVHELSHFPVYPNSSQHQLNLIYLLQNAESQIPSYNLDLEIKDSENKHLDLLLQKVKSKITRPSEDPL